jgi:hypothetical protein
MLNELAMPRLLASWLVPTALLAICAEEMPPVAIPITRAVPDPEVARPDVGITEMNEDTLLQVAAKLVPFALLRICPVPPPVGNPPSAVVITWLIGT